MIKTATFSFFLQLDMHSWTLKQLLLLFCSVRMQRKKLQEVNLVTKVKTLIKQFESKQQKI